MRGGEPRGSARGRDRGIRSATKAGSGAAIVSGAIEDIARRPRGSRREIGRARTRGAPRRRAPPSHNCLTTGALVRKSDGWGGGTAGRAPTTRRTGIREGRTVRVLVGAPEAFNVVPIPPCASAPRGAPLISPATHESVAQRRGRKKKNTRWTLRIQLRALRRAGGRCDVARRTSTSQNRELTSSSAGAAAAFFPLPTAARGTDFSAVLLRFGIGIAGGSPSSPEFACFIPAELALASPRFEPLPTSAAITIFDRIF